MGRNTQGTPADAHGGSRGDPMGARNDEESTLDADFDVSHETIRAVLHQEPPALADMQ